MREFPSLTMLLVAILVLGSAACATKPRPTWTKPGASDADLQHAEAECMNTAGVARAPAPYAGVGAGPPRSEDISSRGRDGYVSCMEAKGYTRNP